MKVLVTGGAGFIGSHVVERLRAEGCDVVVVDDLSTGRRGNLSTDIKFYPLDIRSEQLRDVFLTERPDKVVHLAAQISVSRSVVDPKTDADINVNGTLNLLAAAKQCGVSQIVYGSSAAVYGNPVHVPLGEDALPRPLSPYGVSKRAAEDYLLAGTNSGGPSVVSLRYANAYGPRQALSAECGVSTIFINAVLFGNRPTIFGDGTATRDYVYVQDVAEATWRALSYDKTEVFNISSGIEVSVNELWNEVLSIAGASIEPVRAAERPGDIYRSSLCPIKALNELGWRASTSLSKGLTQTLEYYARGREVHV